MKFNIDLYVVRNREGKYFRAKGYGGYGDTWVDDLQKAKIYTKLSQARSRVTFFNRNWPEYGVPDIVKLEVASLTVIDEADRVAEANRKEEIRKAAQESRRKQFVLEQAEAAYNIAKSHLEKVKERK